MMSGTDRIAPKIRSPKRETVFQKCDHRIRPSYRHGVIVPREEKLIRELLSLSPSTAYRLMRAADT
ncbi:MAG: hypothetical protein ABIM46_09540, partial [candidate division WOR-3 bacterium]